MQAAERETSQLAQVLEARAAELREAERAAAQRDPKFVDPVTQLVRSAELPAEESARWRASLEQGYHFREAAAARARWAQRSVRRIDAMVALMSVGASAAGAAGLVYWPAATAPVMAELALVVVLAVLALRGTRERLRRTWVKCRFLAEFGRVAWYLVPLGFGVDELVAHAKEALPAEPSPHAVLVEVLRRHHSPPAASRAPGASPAYAEHFAGFLQGQFEYHRGAGRVKHQKSEVARTWTTCAFIGATFVTALSAAGAFEAVALDGPTRHTLQFLAIVLPVVGAAALLWGVQREDTRAGRRSLAMAARARTLRSAVLAQTEDRARALAIVAAAKDLAAESHEWTELMRSAV